MASLFDFYILSHGRDSRKQVSKINRARGAISPCMVTHRRQKKVAEKVLGPRGQGALQRELARSRLFRLLRGASRPHRAEAANHHLLDGLHVSLHGVPPVPFNYCQNKHSAIRQHKIPTITLTAIPIFASLAEEGRDRFPVKLTIPNTKLTTSLTNKDTRTSMRMPPKPPVQ